MASKRGEEEEEDLTEEMKNLRELQRQELSKVRDRAGRCPARGWGRAGADPRPCPFVPRSPPTSGS